MPWAEARKRVEGPTLDVLISWRDDIDDDTNVMRDVLREVIIISDDEDGEDTLMKVRTRSDGNEVPRERSVEIISATQNVHTQQLDLAMETPEPERKNEQRVEFMSTRHYLNSQGPQNRLREERQGAQRHQRWEEAIDRQRKHGPSSAMLTRSAPFASEPVYQTPVHSNVSHQPRLLQKPPPASAHYTHEDRRIIPPDESQRYLPLQRFDNDPPHAREPERSGGTGSIKSIPQVSALAREGES